ncbi:MAG: hypothetical protein EZS28_015084 [Streblomastix strix]|uniref:Uncharacterized protein n=1 Tax=Streblomastix strix TaxID=222440 RepID=A0A5J4W3C4_9EUKA|nr:MAG: hypothetical protein EZS28_015084 [Streblomastix strix]
MSEFTQIFEAYNDLCKKLENISCKSLVDVIKQPAEGQKKIAMKIAMLLIMHRNDALKEFAENGIFTSIVDIYDRSGQQQLKGLCDDFISLAASRVKEQGSDFEGAINFMDSLLGISASLQVLIAKKALEAVDGALRQSEMLGQASIQTQYIQMLAENLSFQKNTTDQELKDKETRQNDLQSDIILGRQSNQSKYRSLCVLFHMIKNNASSNSSIIPVSSTSAQQSASAAAASSASQEALIASLRWVDPIYPILQQLNYKQKEEEDNLVSTGASKRFNE